MYENIKTNFQAKQIFEGHVRMWQEGKTLETFILEGEQKGILESEQIRMQKGEYQKARETVKKLKNIGESIQKPKRATFVKLNEKDLD